jgi:hypothetical protein
MFASTPMERCHRRTGINSNIEPMRRPALRINNRLQNNASDCRKDFRFLLSNFPRCWRCIMTMQVHVGKDTAVCHPEPVHGL